MRLSVPASFLIHGALLLWAFVHIMHTPELPPPQQESIAVSMVTPSELLRLKQGSEDSKELDAKPKEEPKPDVSKKEAEKPKPIDGPPPAAEPPPPQEEANPPEPPKPEPPKEEPKPAEAKPVEPPKTDPIADQIAAIPPKPPDPAPGPTPDELKKIEDEKQAEEAKKAEEQKKVEEAKKEEEKKKAEDKRKEEEKKKAEEKKRKEKEKKLAEAKKKKEEEAKKKVSEADRLAALLDKTPDKRGAPRAATEPETKTDYTGPTAGAREGKDNVLSAREVDMLNGRVAEQLKACWRLPGAGGGIETTLVTVTWRLRQDGSLDGEPALERAQSGTLYQQAADAAIRAVKNCSPFDLPQDKYQFWSKITFDFDPREMMR